MYYIGYSTLEAFLASCEPETPLFATLTETSRSGPYGVPVREFEVRVFQVRRSDGLAHYWLWRVGREIGHQPDKDVRDRAFSAYEAVKAILENGGFQYSEATVAIPENLVLQGGGTERIKYDKETDRFLTE